LPLAQNRIAYRNPIVGQRISSVNDDSDGKKEVSTGTAHGLKMHPRLEVLVLFHTMNTSVLINNGKKLHIPRNSVGTALFIKKLLLYVGLHRWKHEESATRSYRDTIHRNV
jgi:hypothetical protein